MKVGFDTGLCVVLLASMAGPIPGQSLPPGLGARIPGKFTTRESVDSAGSQANRDSEGPKLSDNGRYLAFYSVASNLVAGDTNGTGDAFVRDRSSGTTTRVSVASDGTQGNGTSSPASISADGRYVTFTSRASNLVPGDTNQVRDAFVHDRVTGTTERVSLSSAGVQGDHNSSSGSISADGRFVAFQSGATNLVPLDDALGTSDVFVRDRVNGTTTRVSVDSAGVKGNSSSLVPLISADGRHVVFESYASNLVPQDTNGFVDVFVHDRQTASTRRVSVDSLGAQANSDCYYPSTSGDARYVAFASDASNLVADDTNGESDIFVHDRSSGVTTRASVGVAGVQGNGESEFSSISPDGRFVVFVSHASNLVLQDTNGTGDVFLRDRAVGTTRRVNVTSAGAQTHEFEFYGLHGLPAVSSVGRFVAFHGEATDLVPGDTNAAKDVFVRKVY